MYARVEHSFLRFVLSCTQISLRPLTPISFASPLTLQLQQYTFSAPSTSIDLYARAESSIAIVMHKSLHWEQRIALVRHNLHAASRSGDFTFFKTLQAQSFIEGTNHVATLSATLGEEADAVISGLDDLNGSIAYVHQDAFKNVYTSLKSYFADDQDAKGVACRSKVYVDATMQKQMADHAVDKMTGSAIALIQQQPETTQDTAASIWITGNTIIADCMEVCIKQVDMLENNMNDFIRLEDSWDTVKASVGRSVFALKGIFNLMAVESSDDNLTSRPSSGSFNFGGGNMFRRLSNALVGGSAPSSRQSSFSVPLSASKRDSLMPEYRTPNYLRNSMSGAVPTSLPPTASSPFHQFQHSMLSTIPPTPAAMDDNINPFDTSIPVPDLPAPPKLRLTQAVMVIM